MKKLLYPAMVVGAFALASCSSEEPVGTTMEGDAVFTVTLPADLASRATLGDETRGTMDKLMWTIYEVNGTSTEAVATQDYQTQFGAAPFANSATTQQVTLNLGKGKTYKVVFFACNSANYGTDGALTFDEGVMTVNYDNIAGQTNDVNADAFTGVSVEVTGGNAVSDAVELTRPFAQLNWGTNDLDAQTVATYFNNDLSAAVTVEGDLYPSFDALNGTVSGTAVTSATFNAYTVKTLYPNGLDDADAVSFPVDGYNLVAMNYLLVGAEGTLNSCTLEFNNGFEPVEVNSVTVKQNYRTNIYGALLTNPTEFNVQIAPSFDGNENVMPGVWDGTTVTAPAVDDDAKTVTIGEGSDLAGLAQMVNEGKFPEGYTVLLTKDLDLDGHPFTPVGNAYQRSGDGLSGDSGFTGVIDGQGHTISNVNVDATGIPADGIAAVFTTVSGADSAIKNINFKNLTIDGGASEQVGAVGLMVKGATVNNVNILSGSLKGAGAVGLVARMMRTGTISNCNNAAEIVSTKNNAGGIVGAAYYNSTEARMLIENCHNTGNVSASNVAAGGIVGLSAADIKNCTNTGAVTCGNNSVGGIVGGIWSSGVISGCVNSGKVTNTGNSVGTGGIVGWLHYETLTNYPRREIIVVENCTNNADVTGGSNTGGIVGTWYFAGKCLNNTNNAKVISASAATSYAGGIIGYQEFTSVNGDPFPGENLIVTGNVSTTPLADIIATNKGEILFMKSPGHVTLSDNTPNQQ